MGLAFFISIAATATAARRRRLVLAAFRAFTAPTINAARFARRTLPRLRPTVRTLDFLTLRPVAIVNASQPVPRAPREKLDTIRARARSGIPVLRAKDDPSGGATRAASP